MQEEQEQEQEAGSDDAWEQRGPPSLLQLAEEQLLQGIRQASRHIEAPFCVGGSLGKLPVQLAVRPAAGASGEVAILCFPDGGRDALAKLVASCAPASFGKGTKEVLDDGYRRALALPADRIFPHFHLAQHPGVLAAVRSLLLPDAGELSARLHTLKVYTQGGFFKPHRDTPRGDPSFVGSLVVCLPVGHAGGALRVEHSGRSVAYGWGPGAAAGEVQWAAFFPSCLHQVLPVQEGARVTLAYELFAQPAGTAKQAQPTALPGTAAELLRALRPAMDCPSFMVNGGRLGFPCKHGYPNSLFEGVTEQAVRQLLKGEDAALLHALEALGIPCKLMRVWKDEEGYDDWAEGWDSEEGLERYKSALRVGPSMAAYLAGADEDVHCQDAGSAWLEYVMQARKDEWVLGGSDRFYYGNYPTTLAEFYCAVAIVAEVPAYADRPAAGAMAWAGRDAAGTRAGSGAAAGPSSPTGSPQAKRAKHDAAEAGEG
ncbi:hypothetical protein ABPG75_012889 [Micractinium tetrahymenae]